MPTPDGVPVRITSPGRKVYHRERYEISSAMEKIKSLTGEDCMTAPFNRVRKCRAAGSGISSIVVNTGPRAVNPGSCLP